MNNALLLLNVEDYVKKRMEGGEPGHDWFHIQRVVRLAKQITKEEKNIDVSIVELASLLHDIGDWKVRDKEKSEEEVLEGVMNELSFSQDLKKEIMGIILNMSYSANLDGKKRLSPEGKIVQDADRLDALGAIGIARAFAYGGKKGRALYDPSVKPQRFTSPIAYRLAQGTTINHFYEKLFFLKELLHTKTAKKIARKREKFMKEFLEEFYQEWEGEK